ncbi:MAG TPA: metal-dependent transcriptional regulator, partial [Thermoanaerobacterales bacterium]|nr:metal-dependent transcriptional regulator [Thermoanaerobacterales bacterium]
MSTKKIEISPSLEDYLETILNISLSDENVRITDLSEALDVAKSSVHQAVCQLKKAGLVTQEKYGPVNLTDSGQKEATRIKKKHDILANFFENILGVDKKTAQRDACLIEHSISPATIKKLMEFC